MSLLGMAYQKQMDNLKQPGTPRKSKYLMMFLRSFIASYGQPLGKLTDEQVLVRLHNWNCEWLKRPRVAISELADTIQHTLPIFQQALDVKLAPTHVNYLKQVFDPLANMLARMNHKDHTVGNEVSERDLQKMMRLLQEDKKLEKEIQEMFEVSGAMFVFSVQIMALQTLLGNPREFAEKVLDSRSSKHFKEDPSHKEMREYLFSSSHRNIRSTETTRSSNRKISLD